MAIDSTAELLFRIGADTSGAEGNIKRFRAILGKDLGQIQTEFSQWAEKTFGNLGTVKGALLGVTAAAAAAAVVIGAALVHAAEKAAAYARKIDEIADKTGLSVEAASRLSFAAEHLGVGHERLTRSLVFFGAALDKARGGSEEQLASFRRLGITQEDLTRDGGDLEKMLLRVSDAFRSSSDATAKARISRELFSRGGADFIDFLNRGSAGIGEFTRKAEELGLVLHDKDIVAAKQFRLELQLLHNQVEALTLQVGRKTIPTLVQFLIIGQAGAAAIKQIIATGGGYTEFALRMGVETAKVTAELLKLVKAAESAPLGPPLGGGGKEGKPFVLGRFEERLERPAPSLKSFGERFEELISKEEMEEMEKILDWLDEFERQMLEAGRAAVDGLARPLTEVVSPAWRQSARDMMEWEAAAVRAPNAAADSWQKSLGMMKHGLGEWNQAMGTSIAFAIVYRRSVGEAFQAATAAALASIAAEAFVQAIYATALGFLRLAMWDFAGAANAFTAAGIFASVGGAAALAGRAIAPRQAGAGGVSPVGIVGGPLAGEGGTPGGPPRSGVTIIIQGHVVGRAGIEELTDLINEAVRDRDVRLISTSSRGVH